MWSFPSISSRTFLPLDFRITTSVSSSLVRNIQSHHFLPLTLKPVSSMYLHFAFRIFSSFLSYSFQYIVDSFYTDLKVYVFTHPTSTSTSVNCWATAASMLTGLSSWSHESMSLSHYAMFRWSSFEQHALRKRFSLLHCWSALRPDEAQMWTST